MKNKIFGIIGIIGLILVFIGIPASFLLVLWELIFGKYQFPY